MIKETRTIHYDAELAIEAYWLQNVLEPFPDHFHDYYLIGFIEKGARELTCGGQKYITTEGDLFTLNPMSRTAAAPMTENRSATGASACCPTSCARPCGKSRGRPFCRGSGSAS